MARYARIKGRLRSQTPATGFPCPDLPSVGERHHLYTRESHESKTQKKVTKGRVLQGTTYHQNAPRSRQDSILEPLSASWLGNPRAGRNKRGFRLFHLSNGAHLPDPGLMTEWGQRSPNPLCALLRLSGRKPSLAIDDDALLLTAHARKLLVGLQQQMRALFPWNVAAAATPERH